MEHLIRICIAPLIQQVCNTLTGSEMFLFFFNFRTSMVKSVNVPIFMVDTVESSLRVLQISHGL